MIPTEAELDAGVAGVRADAGEEGEAAGAAAEAGSTAKS
jgi:hypothetical protein